MTDWVLLIARILMAGCFIPAAITRVPNISGFSLNLSAQGIPYPNTVAALIAVAEIFGPAALIMGFAPRVSAVVLIAATVVSTVALHPFWSFFGAARSPEQALVLANTALMAGLLLYAVSGPGAWSWQAFWEKTGDTQKKTSKQATRTKPGPTKRSHLPDAA